jgi:predicted metal-binding membrane protein
MSTLDPVRQRFDLRDVPVVVLVTYVIALLAWVAVVGRWLPMPGSGGGTGVETGTGMGMADPGAPEAMALSNGVVGVALYLFMWGVMMVAMMYPSSVPLFRLYYKTLDGVPKRGRAARVSAFMGTYALVWTLTGVVPLVVNAVVPVAAVANEHGTLLLGGSLLGLSAYQLSSYKYRCLRYCRSPLGFLMGHHRPGVRGAVRTSWQFSVFCIGCCWALFAFMVVVGSMNVLWMALITVVLSAERTVAWGERLARAVGAVAGVAGVALVAVAVV